MIRRSRMPFTWLRKAIITRWKNTASHIATRKGCVEVNFGQRPLYCGYKFGKWWISCSKGSLCNGIEATILKPGKKHRNSCCICGSTKVTVEVLEMHVSDGKIVAPSFTSAHVLILDRLGLQNLMLS